jgi:lysophospholipase L1-like esterase
MIKFVRSSAAAAILLGAALMYSPLAAQSRPSEHWVATWATAPIARVPAAQIAAGAGRAAPAAAAATATATAAPNQPAAAAGQAPAAAGRGGVAPRPPFYPNNQTLRQIAHVSLGGNRIRVVLSNIFGTTPLQIGAAHVAIRERGSSVVPGTDRPLTFSGASVATVPANAVLVSDPVSLSVPNFADLAIDLYVPNDTAAGTVSVHPAAFTTNYVVPGNHAGDADWSSATTNTSWYYLDHIEVAAPEKTPVVVMMGDSITDGTASTIDANHRWGDVLTHRLLQEKGGRPIAVVNAGIAANRVLSQVGGNAGNNALARFEHDVLMRPGVQFVTVLEAINDIGQARQNAQPSAEDLIGGHRQMIARAHMLGIKMLGATLTPYEGAAYYSDLGEQKREAVNQWIRTSHEYDGVIDFEAAVRDPQHPTKFLPQFDSGDHLHPSDAGYEAMGNAINVALFK